MTTPIAPKSDQPPQEPSPAKPISDEARKRVQKMRKTSQTLTPEQIKELMQVKKEEKK